MDNIWNFLENLEVEHSQSAIGLLVEVIDDEGYDRLIGPYPIDTAEACAVIERLRAEEEKDPELPRNHYSLRLLFPTTTAEVPK